MPYFEGEEELTEIDIAKLIKNTIENEVINSPMTTHDLVLALINLGRLARGGVEPRKVILFYLQHHPHLRHLE